MYTKSVAWDFASTFFCTTTQNQTSICRSNTQTLRCNQTKSITKATLTTTNLTAQLLRYTKPFPSLSKSAS